MIFSKKEIKANLLGCFETILFMPEGIERFIIDKSAVKRSFFIPLLVFPFLLFMYLVQPHTVSIPALIIILALKVIFPLTLYLTLAYQFCKKLNRQNHFQRFVVIYNWLEIPMLILYLPVIIAAGYGILEHPQIQSYTVFAVLVGYMYIGYIATKTLRVSWELGVLMGVVAMAVYDNTHKLFNYLDIL